MKQNKLFTNWSPLELVMLGVVVLLVCAGIGLSVAFWGGLFLEETAQQPGATPTDVAGLVTTPAPGGEEESDEGGDQSIVLSPNIAIPGSTVKVQGQDWPAQRRVIISLVPSNPPSFAVNSAVTGDDGRFSVEIIVPSDPRWLNESPVPVLAQLDDGSLSSQAFLNITTPTDGPPVTPIRVIDVIPIQPTATSPPPPPSVPQLTATANVNVRSGPGTNYAVLGVLLVGQKAEIIGRNADATWWQIRFPGAPQGVGWVSAAFATAENIANIPIVNAPPPPPPPPPTPTPIPNVVITDWRGEYFNNMNLSGAPVFVRNDVAISFDWGLGSPDPRIPVDFFSIRWTRSLDFAAGVYRFYTRTDDGVRLWIDGALVVNKWQDQSPTTHISEIYLNQGPHNIRVEYYERQLGAMAVLTWARVGDVPEPTRGPIAVIRSPSEGVAGQPVTFDGGRSIRGDSDIDRYRWEFGEGNQADGKRVSHTYANPGDYRVRLTVTDRNGLRDRTSVNIKINQDLQASTPPIAVIRGPTHGTVGDSLTFDGSASQSLSPIVNYQWELGDGTTARGQTVSHRYNQANTYRVRLTVIAENGLRGSDSVDIRIDDPLNPNDLIARIQGPSVVEVGQEASFNGNASTINNQLTSATWSFGDGGTADGLQATYTYQTKGNYIVTLALVDDKGLNSTATQAVNVIDPPPPDAPPIAVINVDVTGRVFAGDPITFDGSASKPDTLDPAGFEWDFGDQNSDSGKNVVQHAYATEGSYVVTLKITDAQQQSNSTTRQINVDPPPQPPTAVITSKPDQGVVGKSIEFAVAVEQASGQITNIAWDFDDGSTGQGSTVSHVYDQPGSYNVTVTLTDEFDLEAVAQKSMQVVPAASNNPPVAKIEVIPPSGEVGQSIKFDGSGSHGDNALITYAWDLGDNNQGSGPVVEHVYDSPGMYNVNLTVTDDQNQIGTDLVQIEISSVAVPLPEVDPPQADINVSTTEALVGEPITFDASGSVAPGQAVYSWDFGDNSQDSGVTVQHAYDSPGAFNVTLNITNEAGSNSSSVSVTIQGADIPEPDPTPPPVPPTATPEPVPPTATPDIEQPVTPPQAVILGPDQGLVNEPLTFDGSQSQSGAPIVSFFWDFGDGLTDNSGMAVGHSYSAPGSYQVSLTVTDANNLQSIDSYVIQIDDVPVPTPLPPTPLPQPLPVDPPHAVIEAPDQGVVGQGLLFDGSYSQSGSPIISFMWDFGDGMTDDSGMGVGHSYVAPGTYNVTLTVTDQNGQSDSTNHVIQIDPAPVPEQRPIPEPPTPVPEPPTPVPEAPTPIPEPPTATPEPPAPEGQSSEGNDAESDGGDTGESGGE